MDDRKTLKSSIYYHYTSLEALFQIVKSRSFRMTCLQYTNDKREMFYRKDNLLTDLESIIKRAHNCDERVFLEKMYSSMDQFDKELNKAVNVPYKPFALCLANKRDNLTHWDRYADHLQGVCLGINTNALKAQNKRSEEEVFANTLFEMGPVLYQNEDIKDYILQECLRYYIESHSDTVYGIMTKRMIEEAPYIILASICFHLMMFCKDSSFVDEDEYRVYHDAEAIKRTTKLLDKMIRESGEQHASIKDGFMKVVDSFKLESEFGFSPKRGIYEYADLCLNDIWGSDTIQEVIIGPLCRQDKKTLKRFLYNNGLKGTKVTISKVPIR